MKPSREHRAGLLVMPASSVIMLTFLVSIALSDEQGSTATCANVSHDQDTLFLFTSFRGNGADGLRFAFSADGYRWQEIPGTFLKPQVGKLSLMRDPSLIRGLDDTFHLVWTTGWKDDQGFGHASSEDISDLVSFPNDHKHGTDLRVTRKEIEHLLTSATGPAHE